MAGEFSGTARKAFASFRKVILKKDNYHVTQNIMFHFYCEYLILVQYNFKKSSLALKGIFFAKTLKSSKISHLSCIHFCFVDFFKARMQEYFVIAVELCNEN